MKNQLSDIHEALANVDNLDYIIEPFKMPSKDIMDEMEMKNSESFLSTGGKRVQQLKSSESIAEIVSEFQSKSNSENTSIRSLPAASSKKRENSFSRISRLSEPKAPATSPIKKFIPRKIFTPPPPKRSFLRPSVQQILDEAKVKHELHNLERNKITMKIPVINLALN
jgi:hypothetical protein